MILVWTALGSLPAFSKGQLGLEVTWIGGTIHTESNGVRAKVKQSIIDDIFTDLRKIRSQNVTSKKDLRSLLGKLAHAAGLLIVLRPLMEPTWAAWAGEGSFGRKM